MRIDLTVRHRGVTRDVAVDAAPGIPLVAVGSAVAAACGVDASGSGPLSGPGSWGDGTIRTGTLVDTGGRADTGHAGACLQVVGGPSAGRTHPLDRGTIRIGRSAECGLALDDVDASRVHAAVTVGQTCVTVRDLDSTNGTLLDGVRVGTEPVPLVAGSMLRVGGSLLTVAPPSDPPAALSAGDGSTLRVSVPPRRPFPLTPVVLDEPAAAADARPRAVQWVTALVPAIAGGALAWAMGSPQFLLFALLSPVMVLSGAVGDRLHWRRDRRRAAAEHNRGTAELARATTAALRHETAIRRSRAPDAAELLRIAQLPTDRLWERGRGDDDLLRVRVGTGSLLSYAVLRRRDDDRPAGLLSDVPICADLADGPLGVAGPRRTALGLARHVLGRLATLCSPADVRLTLLLSEDRAADWRWARWLPHLDARVAVGAEAWPALIDDVAVGAGSPWTVLVADGGVELTAVPALTALLRRGHTGRTGGTGGSVTAIVLADDAGELPAACRTIAHAAGETGNALRLRSAGGDEPDAAAGLSDAGLVDAGLVDADLVDAEWADSLARALAPLAPGDAGRHTLPAGCTLAIHGELDAASVAAQWAGSHGGAAAVVGLTVDGPLELDLAADGPHALVAGTTGSGKSEFLQALVVGLALRQPPDALTVLLIDYKGGAAFGGCTRLPHAAGLVTDLDPCLTRRALRSLQAELRRRETLLARAGASDLIAYRATGPRVPIPRLVIVVDEFATMAEELPDFVHGLVSVARRGRSLGVHLVLATQRPGSAVSPEIRANTALRVALRVTDPGESTDVVGVPDAAAILRSTPGRALVSSDTTLRLVQTAWPGAVSTPHTDAVRVELLDGWRRRPDAPAGDASARTDLDRLVDELSACAEALGLPAATPPWMPALPDVLAHDRLPAPSAATTVRVGLVDLPDEQRLDHLDLDLLAAESLLVVGSSRSGRTTALAVLAAAATARLSPDQLELYVLDPVGPLLEEVGRLGHCRTALDGVDPALVLRLLTLLEQECARRAAATGRGRDRPMVLLADGWDVLLAALDDADALQCATQLTALLRIGPAAGLTIAVTGDRTLLAPRVGSGFAHRVALRLSDATDYQAVGVAARGVPGELPPGRGVRAGDGATVQLATRPAPSTVPSRARLPAGGGIRVRPLPRSVGLAGLVAGVDVSDGRWLVLGVAGDLSEPLRIDPLTGHVRFLVAGPPRSGRSTLLISVLTQAVRRGVGVTVACTSRSTLAAAAREHPHVVLLDPDARTDPEAPTRPTLLLVDDCELWADSPLADTLTTWLRRPDVTLGAFVAGRSDDLVTTFRGLGAEARRQRCGVLLQPGPVDGDLLGVRLSRRRASGPPGRGVVVGEPSWGVMFRGGEPVPIQVALP